VSGDSRKIEILKPFEEAFELMKKMLFQPFNFEKWLVLGFAAFLAGHYAGMGFNFPFGGFPPGQTNHNQISSEWEEWKPWLIVAIALAAVLFFLLIIVLMWLKARGNFILTDCIARNRAAIVDPWREYRREGNSYFLYLLIVMFGSIFIFGMLCLLGFGILAASGQGISNTRMTPLLVFFLAFFFLVWLGFAFFFGLTSYFMIPLMYVRRCRAAEAFRTVAGLVLEHVGSLILFCLFGFCLLIGAIIVGGIATCATCCMAGLPYIGTVILLPVLICLRGYALLFIRQFGPEYDVWAAITAGSVEQSPQPPQLPA